jgi:RNA polymerase sigma-70 factor (ECF subfamily)
MSPKPEFEQLVADHSREIYVYLWRMTYDESTAEDCLQDTFLRAYKAYPRLDGEANCRAWLYKIATNVARAQLKRLQKEGLRQISLDPKRLSDGRSAADQVEAKLSFDAVLAAVDKLPHKQRSALLMRKYQELSYAEIAESLNSSEDAARANVYQALRKLRKQLAQA